MLSKTDSSTFADYLEDSSGLTGGYAEKIVFPETEQEATEFFRTITGKSLKVTISGAGTGVVGGRIPNGGIILSTDKLNKILEITKFKDKSGGLAIVEPGVRIEDLKEEAERKGLAYLPDPTEKNAFIGGTIATNASGARGFKYGSTRNWIESLRVVLATGQVLKIRRGEFIVKDNLRINLKYNEFIECSLPDYFLPQIKNAAGYFIRKGTDLIDLFIGQEGTLALVTQVGLKLGELPRENFSGLIFFNEELKALDFVSVLKEKTYAARKNKQVNDIDATCIEYFDGNSLELLREKHPQIPRKKEAAVYFDQDITGNSELKIMEKYIKFTEQLGIDPDEIWLAESAKYKNLLLNLRHDLPVLINERCKRNGFSKISTDIAVSDENFPKMFNLYRSKLRQVKIPYCRFGHIGENHIHVNLMPENKADFLSAKQIYMEFIKEAVRLGGTISAEHGIGKLKREYLKIMIGAQGMRQLAVIKRSLDPELILGVGNIFAEELLHGA